MGSQLRETCSEFEQAILTSHVPQSFSRLGTDGADASENDQGSESDLAAEHFPQAFAAALERAGGVGLRTEFFQALTEHP